MKVIKEKQRMVITMNKDFKIKNNKIVYIQIIWWIEENKLYWEDHKLL
jgi:hypothetical protein